jgi:hypothetical protein
MATRKLVAHHNTKHNQILKMDSISRFIVNDSPKWQFIFNANSEFTNSTQVAKVTAEFDTSNLSKIRVTGYLYNPANGTVDNADSCSVKLFRVEKQVNPRWNEVLVTTLSTTQDANSYYFVDIDTSSITGANLDGDTTLMLEATITRLGRTYRERVYVNHLGVYDSIIRLRQDVEWLDISKLDE